MRRGSPYLGGTRSPSPRDHSREKAPVQGASSPTTDPAFRKSPSLSLPLLPLGTTPARLTFMLRNILRTMRPRQWPKNAFLFAALVFDRQLISTEPLARTVVGFILPCLASGLVYIIN